MERTEKTSQSSAENKKVFQGEKKQETGKCWLYLPQHPQCCGIQQPSECRQINNCFTAQSHPHSAVRDLKGEFGIGKWL